MKKYTRYIPIVILIAFALLTMFMSGSVIFDLFGIRAKEGNYVLFVVWTNFVCSFLYLLAAFKWHKLKRCTYKILGSSVVILIIAQVLLFIHINSGGIYEEKTVRAMFFRIGVTTIFAIIAYFSLSKLKAQDR